MIDKKINNIKNNDFQKNKKINSNIYYEVTKGDYNELSQEEEYENEEEKGKDEKKIDKFDKKGNCSSSFSTEKLNSKNIGSNYLKNNYQSNENKNIINNNNKNNVIQNKENEFDIEKQTKIKNLEENNSKLINKINELENIIKEKEKIIKNINNTNLKLRNSLIAFSQKLDKELSKNNNNKCINKNNNNNINDINKFKEKELDNAINMIKFLKTETLRLQNLLDEKQKILECENKKYNDILEINNNYKIKNEKLEEKANKLYEENIKLKMNIKKVVIKNDLKLFDNNKNINDNKLTNNKNMTLENTNNIIITQDNSKTKKHVNNLNNNLKFSYLKYSSSLPKLNIKNINNMNLNSDNDLYNNDSLKSLFNDDEIIRIKNIFKNDNDLFKTIINKINILAKSKESLNKKFEYEKKKINERILDMIKQIEFL